MSFVEGQYVSGREEKPWLYDLYDFEKIQEELRKRGFAEAWEIFNKCFSEGMTLKELKQELGSSKSINKTDLTEIFSLLRSDKFKKEEQKPQWLR